MSANGNGHHWSKFCWRDWQKDVALRSCSLGARGFWIECLAAMHEADPVGHLTFNGKPASLKQMATNANCSIKEAERFFAELEEAGVFSRAENGTVFSRRMVRDAQASDIGREHAGKRWRTPNGGPNGVANANPNGDPNAKESESESEKEPPRNPPVKRGGARGAHRPTPDEVRKPFRSGALELIRREMEERDSAVPWADIGAIGHVH